MKPIRKSLFLHNIDPALFEQQRERLNLIIHDQRINGAADLEALEGIRNFMDACSDQFNPQGYTAAQWMNAE